MHFTTCFAFVCFVISVAFSMLREELFLFNSLFPTSGLHTTQVSGASSFWQRILEEHHIFMWAVNDTFACRMQISLSLYSCCRCFFSFPSIRPLRIRSSKTTSFSSPLVHISQKRLRQFFSISFWSVNNPTICPVSTSRKHRFNEYVYSGSSFVVQTVTSSVRHYISSLLHSPDDSDPAAAILSTVFLFFLNRFDTLFDTLSFICFLHTEDPESIAWSWDSLSSLHSGQDDCFPQFPWNRPSL